VPGAVAGLFQFVPGWAKLLIALLGGVALLLAAVVLVERRKLARAESRAATDALTGLPNRRWLQHGLAAMIARAQRGDPRLSVVMFDLDNFKGMNDTHGHLTGDAVLLAVSESVRSALRASDFVGRYGGDEFVALLPGADLEGAVIVTETLRRAISQVEVANLDQSITGSFGVACYPDDGTTEIELLRSADQALYSAKGHGRNRVESAASTLRSVP